MRFSLEAFDPNVHFIRSYGHGWIKVNHREIRCSVIVTPEHLITDWPPQTFAELETKHFAALFALKPEIVLIGTGEQYCFPAPTLLADFWADGIGIEVMDTHAACRTYNLLTQEGRRVAAALFMRCR